jgi:thymidylate synthase (FAD)
MTNNPNFVLPKVFFIGSTSLNLDSIKEYLEETNQTSFIEEIEQAEKEGLNRGEILCSFYAKLCYASLTTTKNKNISKVRAISDNLLNILETGHGSVLEHCYLNFVVTDCSRVFTHELVRHRVGTSFSQTSGRYVRNDVLKLVVDPILEPVQREIEILRKQIEDGYKAIETRMMDGVEDFSKKKKITSALRRIMPNGQSNEIGFGCNLRTLRQTIEARTSRHAEWEIRVIFNQIYLLVKDKYPMIFSDSKVELIDNEYEITFKNKKI